MLLCMLAVIKIAKCKTVNRYLLPNSASKAWNVVDTSSVCLLAPGDPMKVMIVDDSKSMRMIVKRTLKLAGYDDMEFEEADDGTDALDKIDGYGPELVLCDWNMPTMNGIDFLKAIREAGNNVKFGFVTTESTAEMRAAAKEAGAQFLVAKPFTAESFEKALRPVIG